MDTIVIILMFINLKDLFTEDHINNTFVFPNGFLFLSVNTPQI
jgi:hypothetical protein